MNWHYQNLETYLDVKEPTARVEVKSQTSSTNVEPDLHGEMRLGLDYQNEVWNQEIGVRKVRKIALDSV